MFIIIIIIIIIINYHFVEANIWYSRSVSARGLKHCCLPLYAVVALQLAYYMRVA